MTNLTKAIIYASMIQSLLAEFTVEESNNPINELKRVIRKFMERRKKTNTKEFKAALTIGNTIWVKSIKYFYEKEFLIDVYSLIAAIASEEENLLAKFANVTPKRIENFLLSAPDDHTTASEMQAYKIATFLNNEIKNA